MPSSSIEFLLNNELIRINDLDTNTTVLEYLRSYKNYAVFNQILTFFSHIKFYSFISLKLIGDLYV